jgi:hypothetical protein
MSINNHSTLKQTVLGLRLGPEAGYSVSEVTLVVDYNHISDLNKYLVMIRTSREAAGGKPELPPIECFCDQGGYLLLLKHTAQVKDKREFVLDIWKSFDYTSGQTTRACLGVRII